MSGNWEYQVVVYPLDGSLLIDALNKQGAEGWELVMRDERTYYFKRPKAGAGQSNFAR